MGAMLPHSSFSTHSVAPAERFALWRDSISVLFETSLTEDTDPDTFELATSGYLFGPVSQMRCVSSQQNFSRSTMQIDRDGIDHYMIQVFRRGRCHARTPRGEIMMEPGDICVFDNAQTLDSTNEAFDLSALFVPRNLLSPHISRPDGRHLTCIKAHEPLAALLRTHLLGMEKSAPNLTAEQGNLLVAPTISLVAAALNGTPSDNEGGEQALRMAITTTIKQHIDTCLDDPALNADSISEMFGISRTRLYKLFHYTDGVASYIRNRRLSVALGILSDPTQRHRKIIDIALSVGFGSEVSFIRAFRRRYGYTPSEARQERSGQTELSSASTFYDFGDREWETWLRSI